MGEGWPPVGVVQVVEVGEDGMEVLRLLVRVRAWARGRVGGRAGQG